MLPLLGFHRGAAAIMAADRHTHDRSQSAARYIATSPASVINAERRVIFDINDFDETLPAPTSGGIASRQPLDRCGNNGHSADDGGRPSLVAAIAGMATAADEHPLEVWYARNDLKK
jgi:hypothetical protein